VRVNGRVVTELGTKADSEKDRVEVAGDGGGGRAARVFAGEQAAGGDVHAGDPERAKDVEKICCADFLRACIRWEIGVRELGIIFMTNDGDLAAELLKKVGAPGADLLRENQRNADACGLDRVAKKPASRCRRCASPARRAGTVQNYWYEVTIARLEAGSVAPRAVQRKTSA